MEKIKRILLIGFRGAGKTTLGKKMAEFLGLDFIDSDGEIEKREGLSIREIVEKNGWDYFRALEKEFLRELKEREGVVCALGGGAVLHKEELKSLKEDSLIIWVYADLETIKERLLKDEKTLSQRPSLTSLSWEEELKELYEKRLPLYQEWADFVLDSSNNEDIIKFVNIYLKGG